MENILIVNKEKVERLEKKIKSDGFDSFHVLTDFDRTMTYVTQEGKKTSSVIAILRQDKKYLGEEYSKKAEELFMKYRPIEIDPDIEKNQKKAAMKEWWMEHFKLLSEKGLNKKHLEDVVGSGKIKLREGVLEFLDFLDKNSIPLIIMSSSGLGSEVIEMFLENKKRMYPNIHVISNSFFWDSKGNMIGFKEPIVHSLNKDETLVQNFSFFKKIEERRDVILFGDNIEDVDMIDGFDYDFLLKIGFLNEKVDERLEHYKKFYDVLLLNDSSFYFVNKLFGL